MTTHSTGEALSPCIFSYFLFSCISFFMCLPSYFHIFTFIPFTFTPFHPLLCFCQPSKIWETHEGWQKQRRGWKGVQVKGIRVKICFPNFEPTPTPPLPSVGCSCLLFLVFLFLFGVSDYSVHDWYLYANILHRNFLLFTSPRFHERHAMHVSKHITTWCQRHWVRVCARLRIPCY